MAIPVRLKGWRGRLLEQEIGDSKELPRNTFAAAQNVRVDETGGVTGRRGASIKLVGSSVAIGLPNANCRVAEYKGVSIHALVASDGATIWALESTGWTSIGTFPSSGTRASFAVIKRRLYVANGLDIPRVVEYLGGSWSVRAAGLAAPTVAPVMSGGGAAFSLVHAYTYIDDRGFESNMSEIVAYAGDDGTTHTMTINGPIPSNVVAFNIYSGMRDQPEPFFIKKYTIAGAPPFAVTYDTKNTTRHTNIASPYNNDPPLPGIYSLLAQQSRLFGLRASGYPGLEFFSAANQPEYWPPGFAHDLCVVQDTSDAVNFGVAAGGLIVWKGTAALLFDGDPENTTAPLPLLVGAGLVHADAVASRDGLVIGVTQRGLVGHDGVRPPREMWKSVRRSSDGAVAASKVVAATHDTRASFFYRDPDDAAFVAQLSYDQDTDGWLKDRIRVAATTAAVVDATRDFSADTGTHENVENGAQTIASGEYTTVIALTGANDPRLVAGVAMKFQGITTIFIVLDTAGGLTLDQGAPANGTAVEWIRGTVVRDGALQLYGLGG